MVADQTTEYYPYGLSYQNENLNLNRYLYSGKELQDQTINGKLLGLYDFGSRNYDPILGRWFNVDPALQFTNPYIYCANSPMMYQDPNGEWFFSIFGPWFIPLDIALWAATIDYASQVVVNYTQGLKGSKAWFYGVDFFDVGMSFIGGGLTGYLPPLAVWFDYGTDLISNGIDWYGDGEFKIIGDGIGLKDFAVRNAASVGSKYVNQKIIKKGLSTPNKNNSLPDIRLNKKVYDGIFDFTDNYTTITLQNRSKFQLMDTDNNLENWRGLFPHNPQLDDDKKLNDKKKKNNEWKVTIQK